MKQAQVRQPSQQPTLEQPQQTLVVPHFWGLRPQLQPALLQLRPQQQQRLLDCKRRPLLKGERGTGVGLGGSLTS